MRKEFGKLSNTLNYGMFCSYFHKNFEACLSEMESDWPNATQLKRNRAGIGTWVLTLGVKYWSMNYSTPYSLRLKDKIILVRLKVDLIMYLIALDDRHKVQLLVGNHLRVSCSTD